MPRSLAPLVVVLMLGGFVRADEAADKARAKIIEQCKSETGITVTALHDAAKRDKLLVKELQGQTIRVVGYAAFGTNNETLESHVRFGRYTPEDHDPPLLMVVAVRDKDKGPFRLFFRPNRYWGRIKVECRVIGSTGEKNSLAIGAEHAVLIDAK